MAISLDKLGEIKEQFSKLDRLRDEKRVILICTDEECLSKGSRELEEVLFKEIYSNGLKDKVEVIEVSKVGHCEVGPEIEIYPEKVTYVNLSLEDVGDIVNKHLIGGEVIEHLLYTETEEKVSELGSPHPKEVRVVLRNCGIINPMRIEEYIARDGYMALGKALTEMTPEQVIEEVMKSGLRGRGGAGFPTGLKWRFTRAPESDIKYVICNGDEGDPGAFMDRSVLEGDPHGVLEGMAIAGYATGASQGYIYVRAEYPQAVENLSIAIPQARRMELLGEDIMGSGFSFDIELRIGAGAFVCGEETALIASIEGRRGEPRPRPPFPAQKGLWGKPTLVNNVETLANIPQIILRGADWFASMGTEKSKGTKTFAIAGKVKNTGLIEVPMGITMREVIYDIGGGMLDDKQFKAVQTGGPLGGCLPIEFLDVPIDFDSLIEAGSLMGSGGMIIMDEDTCMVDVARFFMEFIQDESCGQCTPCRIGTRRMLEILTRITKGEGTMEDLDTLEELTEYISDTSLCALGQGASNPVISTLRHFRDEYIAHIKNKRCPAGVCLSLSRKAVIDEKKCVACGKCARVCIYDAPEKGKNSYHISTSRCTGCGLCVELCPQRAIEMVELV